MSRLRVVALADTHGLHEGLQVPEGDLLVHAGDLTRVGELEEVERFDAFLGELPHPHKVVIAGNHDFCFERSPREARSRITNATYLEDEALRIEGLTLYGSPWQPWFYDWAFNLHRGEAIRAKWDAIAEGTDILVTHGPPQGVQDWTYDGRRVGCEELARAIDERVRPRLHVFGHIHEAYGRADEGGRISLNASICTLAYEPTNAPLVVDLDV